MSATSRKCCLETQQKGLCLAMAVFIWLWSPKKTMMFKIGHLELWGDISRYLPGYLKDLPGTHSIVPAWRPSWRYTWKTGASAPHLAGPYGALWCPGARWRVEEVPRHEVQSHFATFGPSRLIVLDFVIVTVHIVHGVEEGSPVLNDWWLMRWLLKWIV